VLCIRARTLGDRDVDWSGRRDDADVVCLDVQKMAKCGSRSTLAIRAVTCVREKGGGEEAVADGVADAAACYTGKRA
jgi:hypothetical protein